LLGGHFCFNLCARGHKYLNTYNNRRLKRLLRKKEIYKMYIKTVLVLLVSLVMLSCGGEEKSKSKATSAETTQGALTENQLLNGIGPFSSYELLDLNPELAARGQEVFALKCIACHKTDERLVGPPLKGVLEKRTPAFVLNMILNPDEMVKLHPEVRAMLAEFYVPMTFQNVSEDDAKAILEYLRTL
jgi:mono/diheme cytochrome c family protein